MADRTSNTTFYPSTNPVEIPFKANASDNDTMTIPYGVPEAVLGINAEDDDDAIASASVSGGTVTYDLARQMDGAEEVKCSEFAQAIVERMEPSA